MLWPLGDVSGSSKAGPFEPSAGVEPGRSSRGFFSAALTGFESALARLLAARTREESDFWCFLEGLVFFGDACFAFLTDSAPLLDASPLLSFTGVPNFLGFGDFLSTRVPSSGPAPTEAGKTPMGNDIFGQPRPTCSWEE